MVEQALQTDLTGTPTQDSPPAQEEKQEDRTYTQAEHDKLLNESRAQAGRDVKTLDVERRANEATRKANDTERKNLDSERATLRRTTEATEDANAKASEDPDAFKNLNQRREIQRREEALISERITLDEQQSLVTAAASVMNATRIAAESNVDAETLLKFTDGTEEAMKELALQLQRPEAAPAVEITPDPATGSGARTQAPKTDWDSAKKIVEQIMANPSQDKSKTM